MGIFGPIHSSNGAGAGGGGGNHFPFTTSEETVQ